MAGDLSGSWDLWIAGISSGRMSRLTDDDDREMNPAWSAVTGDVLFSLETSGGSVLQLFEPETKRAIRVGGSTPKAHETEPAWSPDARTMAFVSDREGSRDIYVGPIGGGAPRRLTTLPGSETHPTFSPDGQWIAYASDTGGGGEIWKVPVAGGQPVRLTQKKEGFTGDSQPSWSSSNNWIAFTRGLDGGGSDIYTVPPDGGNPFPMRRAGGARLGDPSFSPAGDYIAYSLSRPDKILILQLGEPAPPVPPIPGQKGTPQGIAPKPKPKPPEQGGQEQPPPENPGEDEAPQDPNSGD
jgi:Tol biopolymer transport system component